MKHYEINPSSSIPINILLADDDVDDRFFFNKALKTLPFYIQLMTIEDGERLLSYLKKNPTKLPDILFLDHNMPRKNGSECLSEIKANPDLKNLPVIMYSTYLHDDVADVLYENGAHFYIRKTNLPDLKKILYHVITLITEKKLIRPLRAQFMLNPIEGTLN
ncbi:MAG TPA: response regulator [Cytophagaceae bacterium]|jgi:response regulator RpfG family c-di-GMP phosphodiesterase|nr:response regulator [Cytophagaceae bacterium]